ncbi:hypothetical protein [Actinokineospora inagensis]|uniref:hypothetical protein n=1 Tax=Actinokineospora inagensis TaxID=103730 RepID=UPI000409880C|nr:hypothetical protein [Actinokineospora inagensis]
MSSTQALPTQVAQVRFGDYPPVSVPTAFEWEPAAGPTVAFSAPLRLSTGNLVAVLYGLVCQGHPVEDLEGDHVHVRALVADQVLNLGLIHVVECENAVRARLRRDHDVIARLNTVVHAAFTLALPRDTRPRPARQPLAALRG